MNVKKKLYAGDSPCMFITTRPWNHLQEQLEQMSFKVKVTSAYLSTSAFYDKAKRKMFSVACKKEEYQKAFTNVGSSFN